MDTTQILLVVLNVVVISAIMVLSGTVKSLLTDLKNK